MSEPTDSNAQETKPVPTGPAGAKLELLPYIIHESTAPKNPLIIPVAATEGVKTDPVDSSLFNGKTPNIEAWAAEAIINALGNLPLHTKSEEAAHGNEPVAPKPTGAPKPPVGIKINKGFGIL